MIMKKIIAVIFTLMSSLFLRAQTDVAVQLAHDPSFTNLVKSSESTLNLLLSAKKSIHFDKGKLLNIDILHVATEVGVSSDVIARLTDEIKSLREELIRSQPALATLTASNIEATIQQALAINNGTETVKKLSIFADPCSDCKRNGRAAMIAGLVIGASSCGGSLWGLWGCGFLGWWTAAEATLACIRQHCPQNH